MLKTPDLQPLLDFLPCATPGGWVDAALDNLDLLLIDHANCEKKAAATAMGLMHRYPDQTQLINKMSRLAREELRHFEQVNQIMARRGVTYRTVSASRYASGLHAAIRKKDPGRLVDTLLVGALIEARSCERFAALVPHLDSELAKFYASLLKSESRHFMDYLKLAGALATQEEVGDRLQVLAPLERQLIESPDSELRFHSGIPEAA